MPGSNPQGKPDILEFVIKHEDIKTIVDFGAGQGIYCNLIKGVMPHIKMIAVEIWKPYIEKYKLNERYDQVNNSNILTDEWPEADMAIFGDVLEHMEMQEAIGTVESALQKYRHVAISIPIADTLQGPECGNPYEEHKYLWTMDELNQIFGPKFLFRKYDPPLIIMIK
jgi:hypothetical protein